MQKLFFTNKVEDINQHLEKGWKVVSITPQHVVSGYVNNDTFAILIEISDEKLSELKRQSDNK